ncbi:endonuclease/exonuclease/phosphatase family protein [Mesorhizobium captivum]|uniref:endonuclease/exonuclease/phosphatase family protein n=1 Tax=Mesorhizobium captivum TaxID=3072319 RepID=UPI002A2438C3|nr:endonuclease/exonuclease/phosphatase family protein [Mesorhizobium sp. VK3C]MDX8450228.1 endonuclease/exonuclease/phosphatase family protein [Mesorhizobium sp. VK3C]
MKTIRLMTFNIHSAIGRDEKVDVDRVVNVIESADIIALQEVDNFWERSGNVSQVDLFTKALPNWSHAWNPNIDLWKSPELRRQYGNLLLSRFPVLSIKRHALPKSVQSDQLCLQCGVLEAIVAAPSGNIRVYATHVISSDSPAQIQRLMEICRSSLAEGAAISGSHYDATWFEEPLPAAVPEATILLGDLNVRPGSREYHAITTTSIGKGGCQFIDAWAKSNQDLAPCAERVSENDPGATYYLDYDGKSGERLDYCFVSSDISSRILSADVLSDVDASDHQPLLVALDSTTGQA